MTAGTLAGAVREIPASADVLTARRLHLGLSPEEVSLKTQGLVSPSTVRAVETGRTDVRELAAVRSVALASALQFSLEQWLDLLSAQGAFVLQALPEESMVPVYALGTVRSGVIPETAASSVRWPDLPEGQLLVQVEEADAGVIDRDMVWPQSVLAVTLRPQACASGAVFLVLHEDVLLLRRLHQTRYGQVWRAGGRSVVDDLPFEVVQVLARIERTWRPPRVPRHHAR